MVDQAEEREEAAQEPSASGGARVPWRPFAGLVLAALGAAIVAYDGQGFRLPSMPEVPQVSWRPLLAFGPILLLMAACLLWALRSKRSVPAGRPGLVTTAALLVAALAASKAILLTRPLEGLSWASPVVLLPVVAFVLPVAATCSTRFDLFFVIALALLVGLADPRRDGGQWGIALAVLGAGLPAALLGGRAHGRVALILAGAVGGGGLSLAAGGARLFSAGWDPLAGAAFPEGIVEVTAGLPNGLLCGLVVATALPIIEPILGRTSNVSLAGLLRLDHPLLLWIQENAPGTYHHSVNVGLLAAAAARRIRANPLLAQAGGHFHDLGKVKRAGYFMENIRGRNPHDEMSPKNSARIILSHAHEGFEIARRKGLPPEVAAIAREHQGTTLVEWFYARARRGGDDVDEADYRYRGPKPRGMEAALVMLADSVEALSRSLENPDREAFEKGVDFILQKKEADGQLEESGIRRGHHARIREAFVLGLEDIHHRRVRYPTTQEGLTEPPGTPEPGSPARPPGGTSR